MNLQHDTSGRVSFYLWPFFPKVMGSLHSPNALHSGDSEVSALGSVFNHWEMGADGLFRLSTDTLYFRIFWQSPTPLPTAGKVKRHSHVAYSPCSDSICQLSHFLGSFPNKPLILCLSPPQNTLYYISLSAYLFVCVYVKTLFFVNNMKQFL